MELKSDAFAAGDNIPVQYTCDGDNISPPLVFEGVPENTVSLVLICDDPDAPSKPNFTHWVLFNLSPQVFSLAEGNAGGGIEGRNDFGENGYGGPCPPQGPSHHYRFRLYALSDALPLMPGASKAEVLEKINGNVLAKAELVALYRRR